jgi:uncharacterized protein (TIGR03790 family)
MVPIHHDADEANTYRIPMRPEARGELVIDIRAHRKIARLLPLLLGITLLLSGTALRAAQPAHSRNEVLLVINVDSPTSAAIAKDYSHRRGVKKSVAIHCADSAVSTANETIALADYKSEIADPISKYLAAHPEINFIVLTKGVPIRIDGGDTGSRDLHSTGNLHPSVDSYLAGIDYPSIQGATRISITGSGATGFVWLNRYWNQPGPFSHAKYGGYLVTRLDGYTLADAESLVRRAIEAEKHGIHGSKVLLDVQPRFGIGDPAAQPFAVTGDIPDESKWGTWNADLVKAGDALAAQGIPVELDKEEAFVGNRSDLIGYFSWGSNDRRYNAQAYQSLTFAPGSIGDTAVSTSARTFLPTKGGQSLIVDLIAHGITGVKGDVDEPLLQSNASPSVLMDHYTHGYTLAESFYVASRFVGWEDIFIGDPLLTPASWPK